jgi:hypothetical protein
VHIYAVAKQLVGAIDSCFTTKHQAPSQDRTHFAPMRDAVHFCSTSKPCAKFSRLGGTRTVTRANLAQVFTPRRHANGNWKPRFAGARLLRPSGRYRTWVCKHAGRRDLCGPATTRQRVRLAPRVHGTQNMQQVRTAPETHLTSRPCGWLAVAGGGGGDERLARTPRPVRAGNHTTARETYAKSSRHAKHAASPHRTRNAPHFAPMRDAVHFCFLDDV